MSSLANFDFDQRLMNSQQTIATSLQFSDLPAQQLFVLIEIVVLVETVV